MMSMNSDNMACTHSDYISNPFSEKLVDILANVRDRLMITAGHDCMIRRVDKIEHDISGAGLVSESHRRPYHFVLSRSKDLEAPSAESIPDRHEKDVTNDRDSRTHFGEKSKPKFGPKNCGSPSMRLANDVRISNISIRTDMRSRCYYLYEPLITYTFHYFQRRRQEWDDKIVPKIESVIMSGSSKTLVSRQGGVKTELCKHWSSKGVCDYGKRCRFAHGEEELRPVIRHTGYKTQPCRLLEEGKRCKYGHRCHFRHESTDNEIQIIDLSGLSSGMNKVTL